VHSHARTVPLLELTAYLYIFIVLFGNLKVQHLLNFENQKWLTLSIYIRFQTMEVVPDESDIISWIEDVSIYVLFFPY
jgi:glycopeptide antibiotics resistance protein